ncbi:MAG TPA: fasciclin domain-containing protein [Chitinophagaceae bacterium]|nr:fasciclin domain-containing protein [Chitinophagaceae bacterium]
MKKIFQLALLISSVIILLSCKDDAKVASTSTASTDQAAKDAGQANVNDDASMKNIVKVAVGSPEHTTLVNALKQAELVDVLANPGPFTVFAPTNAAFNKLPKGTLDELMKPEKKADLQNILQYHVTTSALKADFFKDGQTIGMVNGDNVTVSVKDGKIVLNNSATVVGSVQASNGMVHIIDGVLLPPAKK